MTVLDTAEARFPGHLHSAYDTTARELTVIALQRLAGDVLHITFAAPDGGPLAPYQPGSHLIVTAGDTRNAYSLTGADLNPMRYEISVLRKVDGCGSVWLHDQLEVGMAVEIEGPRCLFPAVADQRHALLVAGGIGVTPVLSHARAIARAGGTADIIYSYRPGHDAHVGDLRELATRPGIELFEVDTIDGTRALLAEQLSAQPLGTHAYACGPIPMLDTYQELAALAGWPAARVHLERFTAPEQDPGQPFSVRVASTGEVLTVPAGVSLLQRLLDAGLTVNNLCRQGVCGECRIPVRAGSLEHRDFVLTEDERDAGDSMLCCVSRGSDIEVDL
ncbi:PDR/VanB family oxidoreductase [Mycobacterium sp. NAZ190054]|uniref:PDR/VanB family oxidoreductase n=1 Tax=Mycobacterium sp. NAZ190054 TaxID=1747766 RepID=UPI000799B8EE|nr:PDR/VanB family oxidoreductase [Mycobacterium sp. NAZ190054]KWX69071.1 ferredoxin [Mycobacterium sp. NAZ190054]